MESTLHQSIEAARKELKRTPLQVNLPDPRRASNTVLQRQDGLGVTKRNDPLSAIRHYMYAHPIEHHWAVLAEILFYVIAGCALR